MKHLSLAAFGLLLASGMLSFACGSTGGAGFDAGGGSDGTTAFSDGPGVHLGDTGPTLGGEGGSGSGDGSGGPTVCDISCTEAGGTCKAGVCTLSENPGGVSGPIQGQLEAGGTSDPLFNWLYPYDQTV